MKNLEKKKNKLVFLWCYFRILKLFLGKNEGLKKNHYNIVIFLRKNFFVINKTNFIEFYGYNITHFIQSVQVFFLKNQKIFFSKRLIFKNKISFFIPTKEGSVQKGKIIVHS